MYRWNPIPLDEFNEYVFLPIYENSGTFNITDPISAHRLAIMFMVLSMGSGMDPVGSMQLVNSEKYYRLACAALMGSETAEQPSIEAVQALVSTSQALDWFTPTKHGQAQYLMNLYLYYYSTPSPKSMNVGYLLNG
jgi:hypothetical protein